MEGDKLRDLDSAIWSNLPAQIGEMIFARLPCKDFFRLRPVCKSWSKLVDSPAFLKSHPAPPSQEQRIFWMTEKCEGFLTLDSQQNKWLCRPTPQFYFKCFAKATGSSGHYFYRLYLETEDGDWKVQVFNFLTKTWQELPPMGKALRTLNLHTLVLDTESLNYRLFVVGGVVKGEEEWIQTYDTTNSQWSIISSYQQALPSFSRLIYQNGVLYEGVELSGHRFKVFTFHLGKKGWQHMYAMLPNNTCNDLMTVSGRLLMVGDKSFSINIWELHSSPLEWKEVSKIDTNELDLYNIDMYPSHGHRDMLCFDSFACGDFVLITGCVHRICMPEKFLLYQLSTNSWIPLTDNVDVLDSSRYLINDAKDIL